MTSREQPCPSCGTTLPANDRYPDHLCEECAVRCTSKDGRLLAFSNMSLTGGFVATYRDDGRRHPGHICYLDGKEHWADEARFGGIVIRPCQDGRRPNDGEMLDREG